MTDICRTCGQPLDTHGTGCTGPQKLMKIPHKCPVCLGYCKIPSRPDGLWPIDMGGNLGPLEIECPTCEGKGVIWEEIPYF